MATKRRSTRQAITRRTKRSPYVDPDTSEDELAYDLETESQTGDAYAPEEAPIAEPPRKRQKTAPRTRHQTRSKSISKPAATRKVGAKRRPNTLHTPPSPKTFKGVSDGRVPDWTSLPIDILRDIFIYASSPIHEQTRTSSSNIDWLVKTARTCRAFAVPALEAFYSRPSLLTSQAPHRLLALLKDKDGHEEGKRAFMGYGVKVKGLEIDVRRLAYSAHNMGLFDICRLVEVCPQLQEVEILHPVDEPPFRTGKIQNWHYPTNLFTTMEEHNTRLRTFRWTRSMIPQTNPETYSLMAATHTSKPFEYLTKLTVCGFDYDPTTTTEDGVLTLATATTPSLATSIALLPRLKDLTLISCEAVVDTFFSHLPHNLERLELTNCLELTSSMLETYLGGNDEQNSGGSSMRELILNHNPSLALSFLVKLRDLCPRLEVLRVDLRYYSERVNSNDAEPLYDVLLGEGEVPTWPGGLRELEMVHLQRWQAEAAQGLFRSLVNAASDLPDLRRLVLHTHISIPWRQRVEVRDQWIDRLQRVYARRSVPPSAHMGSLRQFREFKKAQEEGWDVKATSGRAKLHDLDDEDGDAEFTLGRRISHVAISPKVLGKHIVVYDESSPEKRPTADAAPAQNIRRSRRVAEASHSPPAVVDDSEDDEVDEEAEEEDGEGLYVQGLCNVVDIRIDNQRPRENQFTEGDFLDSEVSGDEDWREGGSEDGEEGLACTNAASPRSPVIPERLSSTPIRYASTHVRHVDPTIYALSTARGRAAIAIIRISGPACLNIYHALCPGKRPPKPRYATVRTLYDPHGRTAGPESVLDASALVLYFPAPRTATGEDLLELHVHGGPAVVKAVLAAIPRCLPFSLGPNRVRYAEPGEFTRRAFMNDRLDLTQVEALGDILSATTEQQRRLSVRGTGRGLAKRYEEWRQLLLYARGELEALIDFSEDQHFDESPSELCASVAAQVDVLRRTLDVHRRNAVRGELLRSGISLALLGAPNAGKSSLLNRIVGREAAIVSAEKGTTRDVVEVGIDLGGYLCRLGDTAGLRTDSTVDNGGLGNAIGDVEREGMRRAKTRAAESDVVIVVLSLEDMDGSTGIHLDAEIVATAAELIRTKDNVLVVLNKTDKISTPGLEDAVQQILRALPGLAKERIHSVSCKAAGIVAGDDMEAGGIQAFLAGLISHFLDLTTALSLGSEYAQATMGPDASIWQDSLGATERHRLLLEECVSYLDAFLAEVHMSRSELAEDPKTSASEDDDEADIVVAAEHLRGAADCLARITGRGEAGDVEEVLGVVFEKFCVGK
ncbi:mitochondrial splicing system protein [Elasticomyces elasticus]